MYKYAAPLSRLFPACAKMLLAGLPDHSSATAIFVSLLASITVATKPRSGIHADTYGAPGEIRTPDPLVRSQMLYPAELRAHTADKPSANNLTVSLPLPMPLKRSMVLAL